MAKQPKIFFEGCITNSFVSHAKDGCLSVLFLFFLSRPECDEKFSPQSSRQGCDGIKDCQELCWELPPRRSTTRWLCLLLLTVKIARAITATRTRTAATATTTKSEPLEESSEDFSVWVVVV